MKSSRKYLLAALAFLVLALVSFLFSKETILGMIRQRADEKAAEAYVASAAAYAVKEPEKTAKESETLVEVSTFESKSAETEGSYETEEQTANETDVPETTECDEPSEDISEKSFMPSYVPVQDDAYYERGGVVYTPEYAVGRIDCVLEIPKISLKRCVYSGTDEEIAIDLDMWFTVSASGDLVPGKTHYAIFGHNHTVQNLSFNRLAEVTLGDWFTLTRGQDVYIYLVTGLFALERSTGRAAYAYDDSLDPSLCYIFTCGRDYMLLNGVSTRYKDFIVEGTLWRTVPISVWQGTEEPDVLEEPPAESLPIEVLPSEEDIHEELSQAAEKIRQVKTAPVITLTREGSLFSDENSFSTTTFSWSMLLVVLTCVFAVISAILFSIFGFMTFKERRIHKRHG